LQDNQISIDCEHDYSPKEKHDYFKLLTVHYWTYINEQLIKLKQLKCLDEGTLTSSASIDHLIISSTLLLANDQTTLASCNNNNSPNSNSALFDIQYYFDYTDQDYMRATTATSDTTTNTPSLDSYDLCDNGDDEVVIVDEIKQKLLVNATELHEDNSDTIIQTSLLYLILNKLETENYKEAISLFNQFDIYAGYCGNDSLNVSVCRRIADCLFEHRNKRQQEVSQDIDTLMDFIEKKLKIKQLVATQQENCNNNNNNVIPVINISELNSTIEEEQQQPVPVPVVAEAEKQPEPIQIVIVEVKKDQEEETFINKSQNEKIKNLIETLKEQQISHTKFNSELLNEQFLYIKDQNKKLNQELNQLNNCARRRHGLLDDFRRVCKEYDTLCDMDSFNKQFKVFYWLFQQPDFSDLFMQQQFFTQPPTPKVSSAAPPPPPPESTKNTSLSTTFSQNEYCTPKQDKSQISMFAVKQPAAAAAATNTPQFYLQKPIGEINFPQINNIDMIERFKDSANKFKELDQSDLDYEDEEEEEEEQDQMIAGNLNQSNKQETFLSCNDEEEYDEEYATGYYTNKNTKYFSNLSSNNSNNANSLNKSSIECLFDQTGQFYELTYNNWSCISRKAVFQILADDGFTQKGHFQAHIICNLNDVNKSLRFDLNEQTCFNKVNTILNSISWTPHNQAFKFDREENCLLELSKCLDECQLRIKRNTRNDSFSSSCTQNNLLRKDITFCLNDNSTVGVALNVSKSLLNQFMISVLHDSKLLFQHVIRKDQKFEIRFVYLFISSKI